MACPVYTREKLNYFRICHVVTDILPQGLRSIFKQEWDSRYQATLGEWKDTPQNGMDFYNRESPRSRTRNARLLETIRNGNRAQWDCTTLFFAILYSNSIGHGLGAAVRSSVDDLREFRNDEFAHLPHGQPSDLQFRVAVRKVENAFQSLGLSVDEIRNICKQKTFPTEELQNVLKNVQTSEEQRRLLEEQHHILAEQLRSDLSSFCILPPKPSHEIEPREGEVCKITKQLERLREGNEDGLSYLYISGNPGSGKSQLAGLVAQKFYETASKDLKSPTFVMTLNAEGSITLLESYASLGRQIKCLESTIMQTLNSTKMHYKEQLNNLKDLIATKIPLYGSWLMVVDNATRLSEVNDFLPLPRNQQWKKGQLLITTQNTSSIPSESSFVSHISVSEGMRPKDACSFLEKVSGIRHQGVEDKVAEALDYQPLALASAGVYVRKIRESQVQSHRTFGWKEYLEKLEGCMRALTEEELTKTNPCYKKSMTVATKLAIERAINNYSIIKSAFTLLSLFPPQPLHFEILMNYILNDKNPCSDKEEIALQIQGNSLFMFEKRENGNFVRMHRVVHEVSKSVINESQEPDEHPHNVALAVTSFNQFIDTYLSNKWHDQNSTPDSEHLIPHLTAFVAEVKNVFLRKDICQDIKGDVFKHSSASECFKRLAVICRNHRDISGAKVYCETALKLAKEDKEEGHCEFGPTPLSLAAIYNLLGKVLRELGDLQNSRENHERALDIQLKYYERAQVDVADTYHHLGNVQHDRGNLEQAMKYHERALEIQKENLGHDHIHLASSFTTMGFVESELGNLQHAQHYFERALDIRLKTPEQKDVNVARIYHELGNVQCKLGDLQKSEKSYKSALNIWSEKLGPDRVNASRTYFGLANVQRILGNLQQAKENCEHALEIQLTELGREHDDVALTYSNLGGIQRELGELKKAKESFEHALNIKLKKLGPEHVDVAPTYHRLGDVQRQLGDMQQAKGYHEKALAVRLRDLEPEHVDIANSYHHLGNVQFELNDMQKAKELYERALDIQLKNLEPDHTFVAFSCQSLGDVHRERGDLELAKEYYTRALNIRLKQFGPQHDYVRRIQNQLRNIQLALEHGT